MVEFDLSDFARVSREFDAAGKVDLLAPLIPSMRKAAVQIKAGMREDMEASPRFKGVARDITFDAVRVSPSEYVVDVGPVTEGKTAGDLAHIAYFGGSPAGGASVRDPEVHLESEAKALEAALDDVLDELL